MSKQTLLLACTALLFAGATQAAATETRPERPALDQRQAPAPTAGDDTKGASENMTPKEGGQALPPDARPALANGGDCDGN